MYIKKVIIGVLNSELRKNNQYINVHRQVIIGVFIQWSDWEKKIKISEKRLREIIRASTLGMINGQIYHTQFYNEKNLIGKLNCVWYRICKFTICLDFTHTVLTQLYELKKISYKSLTTVWAIFPHSYGFGTTVWSFFLS